jgi:hypothetical protein
MLEVAFWVIALAAGAFERAKCLLEIDLVAIRHGFEPFRCGGEELWMPLVVLETAESALVWFEVVRCGCLKTTVLETIYVSLHIRTCWMSATCSSAVG